MSRSRTGTLARRELGFPVSPFSLMRRLTEDMDRIFGDLDFGPSWFSSLAGPTQSFGWTPQIEAFQRGNEFIIRADLPGVEKNDVQVELSDDALTIRGERRQEHEEEREGVWRSERSYGSFVRVIPLPEGAIPESAKANFRNGVLEIVLPAPPREVSRGRRLEISGEEKGTQATPGTQGAQGTQAQQESNPKAQSDKQAS